MPGKKRPPYFSKVVRDLLNYKKNKQRIKILDCKLQSRFDCNAYSYEEGGGSGGNGVFDQTFQKVIDRLESDEAKEYHNKVERITMIEMALAGLSEVERFIIKQKYLDGRKKPDADIHNHYDFPHGKNKYYEIKDEAVEKIAEMMGYKRANKKAN